MYYCLHEHDSGALLFTVNVAPRRRRGKKRVVFTSGVAASFTLRPAVLLRIQRPRPTQGVVSRPVLATLDALLSRETAVQALELCTSSVAT